MTKIKNIGNMSSEEISWDVQNGGKFVMFDYTISIVFMTFKQSSSIYFLKAGESAGKYIAGFSLLTFVFGWWGIPWGPIYSIGSLYTNLSGGRDVTQELLMTIGQQNELIDTLHDR